MTWENIGDYGDYGDGGDHDGEEDRVPSPPPSPPNPPSPPWPPYPPPVDPRTVNRQDYYMQCRRYYIKNNMRFSSWRFARGEEDNACPCLPPNHCNPLCRQQCTEVIETQDAWHNSVYFSVYYVTVYVAALTIVIITCHHMYRLWRTREERAVRRAVRAADRQAAKVEALELELCSRSLPAYFCDMPGGESAMVFPDFEVEAELARRDLLKKIVSTDDSVTLQRVRDPIWVTSERAGDEGRRRRTRVGFAENGAVALEVMEQGTSCASSLYWCIYSLFVLWTTRAPYGTLHAPIPRGTSSTATRIRTPSGLKPSQLCSRTVVSCQPKLRT